MLGQNCAAAGQIVEHLKAMLGMLKAVLFSAENLSLQGFVWPAK